MVTKKILVLALLVSVLFIGCWNDVESYALGRSIYYAFEANLKPETVDRLENRFNRLLDETSGVTIVTPTQTIILFNDMALIIATEHENPYGLMGDLSELFAGAGASYNDDGSMVSVRPIPVGMPRAFSRGWKNSKLEMSTR